MISALFMAGLMLVGQGRTAPRLTCPAGASQVELPAASGGKVLRCVHDSSGNPHGPEVWLRANGFFWQRGRWEQGKRHGTWDRWYPSGHQMARIDYSQGQVVATRCLTEQKRRDQKCSNEWMPLDWSAPTSGDEAAPAEPGRSTGPAIAPMPPLAGEGDGATE